jgi:hypothetical protein
MKNLLLAFLLLLPVTSTAILPQPHDLRLDSFVIQEPGGRHYTGEASQSPPLEYFSLNTLFLRNKFIVHVGHDLINQNYVVFPSPNLERVEKIDKNRVRVTIQQYFPDLEKRILDEYKIVGSKLHYMYITSYEVFDQNGKLLDRITVPDGVQYRPPQFYQLEVDSDVKVLSFVVGFSGRSGWSDSGASSDLQGVYRDLREIGVDQSASIKLEIAAASGVKAYEVLTSSENVRMSQVLSNFHFIAAWGRFAEKDEFLSQILNMKNFQNISIDLTKGAEDLKKYPDIFGNPLDPKWTSVIHKISSSKLTEKERKSDSAVSAKLGIDKLFNFGGDASKKTESRFKEMVQFEADGDFYIPKSIQFSLRADNTFSMLNDMVLQVFGKLEEGRFRYGSGLSLLPNSGAPALGLDLLPFSAESGARQQVDFQCPAGAAIAGFKSVYDNQAFDRKYQFQCAALTEFGNAVPVESCTDSATFQVPQSPHFSFQCNGDAFLIGERSAFMNTQQGRSHSYRCCSFGASQGTKLKKRQCQWSPWVNAHYGTASYSCAAGSLASGVQTEYVNHKRRKHLWVSDRKYRYECCAVLGE